MRLLVVAALYCTLAQPAADAQWHVQYLALPDSLSGLRFPATMLYNPGNNTVFVAGYGHYVFVLDGVTNRKVARIPAAGWSGPMCYNPVENKVYVAQDDGRSILVIDAAANRAVGTVRARAHDLCYNPVMNRVYAVGEDTVTAVACDRDSVVATVALPRRSEDICCVTRGNKVYCVMDDEDVAVIDCSRDSIVKTFYTGAGPYDILYNHRSNRVYISEDRDEDVTVVDAVRDSVIRWLPAGYAPDTMCLNTVSNKVYVTDAGQDWLAIVDCARDTSLPPLFIGTSHTGITFDSLDNLVYLALRSDSVAVIDGRGDTLLSQFGVGARPAGMCYNPRQNLVCVAKRDASAVGVYRGLTNEHVAEQWFWCDFATMAHRSARDEVWGTTSYEALAVFSPARQRVDRFVPVGVNSDLVRYAPELDKLYVGCRSARDTLPVVHCASDSTVAIPGVGGYLRDLCYVPGLRKVYTCSAYDSTLAVIDADGDSVLRKLLPGVDIRAVECSPEFGRVYAADLNQNQVYVLDAVADTVVARVAASSPQQLLHIPEHRLLLCVADAGRLLRVVSTDSNRVVRDLRFGSEVRDMVSDGRANEVYLAVDTSIAVLDLPTLSLRMRIPVRIWVERSAVDSFARRLYCVGNYPRELAVVDLRGDTLMTGPVVRDTFDGFLWDQEHRRLYLSYPDRSELAIVTDTARVGTSENREVGLEKAAATIIRGVLFLGAGTVPQSGASDALGLSRASLLDATGRKLMDLRLGPNDVRDLAPGVYFVCGHKEAGVARVVLVR